MGSISRSVVKILVCTVFLSQCTAFTLSPAPSSRPSPSSSHRKAASPAVEHVRHRPSTCGTTTRRFLPHQRGGCVADGPRSGSGFALSKCVHVCPRRLACFQHFQKSHSKHAHVCSPFRWICVPSTHNLVLLISRARVGAGLLRCFPHFPVRNDQFLGEIATPVRGVGATSLDYMVCSCTVWGPGPPLNSLLVLLPLSAVGVAPSTVVRPATVLSTTRIR